MIRICLLLFAGCGIPVNRRDRPAERPSNRSWLTMPTVQNLCMDVIISILRIMASPMADPGGLPRMLLTPTKVFCRCRDRLHSRRYARRPLCFG
jgi:hypothetical protein